MRCVRYHEAEEIQRRMLRVEMRTLETAIAKLNIILGNRVALEARKLWRRSIRRVLTLRALGVDLEAGSPVPDPPSGVAAMRARLESMAEILEYTAHQVDSRVVTLRRIKAEWEEVGLPMDDPRIEDETALDWKKIYGLESRITDRRDNAGKEADRSMREVEELWKLKHAMGAAMAARAGGDAQSYASGLRKEEERRKTIRREAMAGTVQALRVVGAEESSMRVSMTPQVQNLNERLVLAWDALNVRSSDRSPLEHGLWDALQLGAAIKNCKVLEVAAAAAGAAGDQVFESKKAILAAQHASEMSELRFEVASLRGQLEMGGGGAGSVETTGESSAMQEEVDRLRQNMAKLQEQLELVLGSKPDVHQETQFPPLGSEPDVHQGTQFPEPTEGDQEVGTHEAMAMELLSLFREVGEKEEEHEERDSERGGGVVTLLAKILSGESGRESVMDALEALRVRAAAVNLPDRLAGSLADLKASLGGVKNFSAPNRPGSEAEVSFTTAVISHKVSENTNDINDMGDDTGKGNNDKDIVALSSAVRRMSGLASLQTSLDHFADFLVLWKELGEGPDKASHVVLVHGGDGGGSQQGRRLSLRVEGMDAVAERVAASVALLRESKAERAGRRSDMLGRLEAGWRSLGLPETVLAQVLAETLNPKP